MAANDIATQRPADGPKSQAMEAASRLHAISGRDREFLPAALEILETPPAPGLIALLLTLCVFAAAALTWSFIGRLDVHAVAQGMLEAAGRTKVIQPLDPGRVKTIAVENGERVKAGDLLVEFDPTEAEADEKDYSEAVSASQAEIARRQAEIAVAAKASDGDDLIAPELAMDSSIPKAAQAREEAVFRADLVQLADGLNDLDKQIAQKDATIERLNLSIAFQVKLISTLNQRVEMRNTGVRLNVDTKVNLLDAQETLEKSQSALASDQGQLIETRAGIKELGSQKKKAISLFIADNEAKLADAERKEQDVAEQLAKARARLARTRLLSPIEGTVQQLAITTIGQVVTTGQQLMVIVPSDDPLRVEVYMSNADIGFVKRGQDAVIKVDAFPFTRYGVLHGKVIAIATDAIDDQQARRAEANQTSLANSANASLSSEPRNFVFPVTVAVDERAMRIGGSMIALTPGMTVTAEIKTDSRRVIDYLFSPFAKVASEAMRER